MIARNSVSIIVWSVLGCSGKNIIAGDLNEQTGCSAEAYEEKRRGYSFGFKNKERGNDFSTL